MTPFLWRPVHGVGSFPFASSQASSRFLPFLSCTCDISPPDPAIVSDCKEEVDLLLDNHFSFLWNPRALEPIEDELI